MDCPVCFGDSATLTTRCGHSFCFPCMKQWLIKSGEESKPTCPMCRTTIRFKGLEKIEQSLAEERYDNKCAELFDEFIQSSFEEMQYWVSVVPHFKSLAQRIALKSLKDVEETIRVMKYDYADPDVMADMIDDGAYFNYKKEEKRDRRSMWNTEKRAARYERKHVMNNHR